MKNSFIKNWLPLYAYAGLIFYLSSMPRVLPVAGIDIPFFDKVLHICEYAVFGLLAARAFRSSPRRAFFENFKIIAILTAIIYGISDEFHQALVSERQCSVFDMLADGIGGVLGVFFYGRYNTV